MSPISISVSPVTTNPPKLTHLPPVSHNPTNQQRGYRNTSRSPTLPSEPTKCRAGGRLSDAVSSATAQMLSLTESNGKITRHRATFLIRRFTAAVLPNQARCHGNQMNEIRAAAQPFCFCNHDKGKKLRSVSSEDTERPLRKHLTQIHYTLIYQQNCTLFYFIKNNTLK